jgi:hypothetical protein
VCIFRRANRNPLEANDQQIPRQGHRTACCRRGRHCRKLPSEHWRKRRPFLSVAVPSQVRCPPRQVTKLGRGRWTAFASLPKRQSLNSHPAALGARRAEPSQGGYSPPAGPCEPNFQRAVLCYFWATQNVGMEGAGYFQARLGKALRPMHLRRFNHSVVVPHRSSSGPAVRQLRIDRRAPQRR